MEIKVALAGNPNSGKTTLFNSLTGSNQYVGNWPGVTVEKKEGRLKGNKDVLIVDLPGIYSLSPYTLEEVVTRDFLMNEKPDVIINLVDATNIERNLYLTTQLAEIGIPMVIALNMIDLLKNFGDDINIDKLSKEIGFDIVEVSALKGTGVLEVATKAVELAKRKEKAIPVHKFGSDVERALSQIGSLIKNRDDIPDELLRWFSVKLFERDKKVIEQLKLSGDISDKIEKIISDIEKMHDDDSESIITNERYEFITKVVASTVKKHRGNMTVSDKIDRVVTNRILALPIFALVIFIIYFISVSTLGTIITDWTNDVFFGEWVTGAAATLLTKIGTAEWLSDLILNGIIGGVGSVLGFVPQMFLLFFFLSLLEDCGYMSRVAFIMDKIFRKFGLSGKSFIPLLISSGCGVPGVMATKTIENEKDRRMTTMVTTFIPCGAKIPVIALIAGAMLPDYAGLVAPAVYFIGIFAVIVSGIALKKTKLFAGDPSPFVMELPQYHVPSVKGLWVHMWERGSSFIKKAGTIIFVSSAVIWFLSNFGISGGSVGMVEGSKSFLGMIGGFIAPVFAPLGFGTWQATVATFSGLVAKENVVATFGIFFGLGNEIIEDDPTLLNMVAQLFPSVVAGMSFLIFNMLCAPCFAAIGAIRKEMASGKWTLIAVGYQTLLAYIFSLIIYQVGGLLIGALTFGLGSVAGIIALVFVLYMLFRPNPYLKKDLKM